MKASLVPVAGGHTKQFLRFRLGSHDLSVVLGRCMNVDMADGVCPHGN